MQTTSITFSNKDHRVVSNATVVRFDVQRLVYVTADGGGGTVRLVDLPADLQERFGFDPARAAARDKAESDRRLGESQRRTRQQVAYDPVPAANFGAVEDLKAHAFRAYHGQFYDFSQAIIWFGNRPPAVCPYPAGSPLCGDWAVQKERSEMEGLKWSKFLVQGSLAERRPEGLIVNVAVQDTVETGSVVVQSRYHFPTYSTVWTTKQVLLRGAPDVRISLPLFAIPVGTATVGTAVVEAFDYGVPMQPRAPVRSAANPSDPPSVQFTSPSDAVPETVLNQIKEAAAREWPTDFEMQAFKLKNQASAFRELQQLSPGRVPPEVFQHIRAAAAGEWPGDYEMQLYKIKSELKAYLSLHG